MRTSKSILACIALCFMATLKESRGAESPRVAKTKADFEAMFDGEVRPLLGKYCLDCHSQEDQKGELNLERFTSLGAVRKDVKPWQAMIEQLETGEMPPKKKAQPTAGERELLIAWTRRFLTEEALARAGDPGRVPLRRLSNAEYDRTIRDLTGVDLQPTQDFPTDGAAGEGFTNAAEALSMSPAMMGKYVILYLSSMMTGNHNNDQLPVVMLGSAGGQIKSGRILDYSGKPNRKMCSLYLSMMDKMGIRLDRFGDSDQRLAEV
jgi:hypothetical protein